RRAWAKPGRRGSGWRSAAIRSRRARTTRRCHRKRAPRARAAPTCGCAALPRKVSFVLPFPRRPAAPRPKNEQHDHGGGEHEPLESIALMHRDAGVEPRPVAHETSGRALRIEQNHGRLKRETGLVRITGEIELLPYRHPIAPQCVRGAEAE